VHKERTKVNKRTLLVVLLAVVSFVILIAFTASENVFTFPNESGSYIEITEWTLTDKNGVSAEITLPYTLSYRGDMDDYTLTSTIPPAVSTSANTFRIYPNYMDVEIYIDGEQVYCDHVQDNYSFGATGNVFHYFDLPVSDEEHDVTIKVHCQLGDTTTYYLRPALFGSKTAMFTDDFFNCMPAVILCALLLAVSLTSFMLSKAFGRRLGSSAYLNHFAAFILTFSLYTFLETEFALMLLKNSRFVYMGKFMLLALFIIPLFELILHRVADRLKKIASLSVYIATANYIVQLVLHFSGIYDLCSMMHITHLTAFIGAVILFICLCYSGNGAVRTLLPLLPMILGFLTDILLIYVGHPSFHNSFWFTLGVSLYVLIEVILLLKQYLANFHTMIETNTLKTMAYTDMLTGLGNRNAYEERRKALSDRKTRPALSCIVADVTGLKLINDAHGHSAGDTALIETAEAIRKVLPEGGECFRTGGDEFIILIESSDFGVLNTVVDNLQAEVAERARTRTLPLLLAIGKGVYQLYDDNVTDFIRRVDSLMYADKYIQKQKLREQGFKIRD